MDELKINIRQALRTFAKSPGFTPVVVLTLALGIGANTAIFTLMDQVMLRPLPVKEPERLVVLDGPGAFSGRASQPFEHHPDPCRIRCSSTSATRTPCSRESSPTIPASVHLDGRRADRQRRTATSSPAPSSRCWA